MTRNLILFDFDETYYKHNTNQTDIYYLKEMEELLQKISANNNAITAILTVSTIE
ncbi:hydrolase, partial [Staphylococcus chromogenes]